MTLETPKDRKLAMAEAISLLKALRDPADPDRWYYWSGYSLSYWSVTTEALVRFVELRDERGVRTTGNRDAETSDLWRTCPAGAAYDAWAGEVTRSGVAVERHWLWIKS